MTSTAQWLHYRLGMPLAETAAGGLVAADDHRPGEADLIARQQAVASMPLPVTFLAR